MQIKNIKYREVVMAQLVERSLLIPEVCGSNPVIGKNLYTYIEHLFTVNCELKDKNKEKEAHFFKKKFLLILFRLVKTHECLTTN